MGLRQERLGDEIRDIVASSISSGRMGDPRLLHVVVTAVKLSGDLQQARVFFRLMSEDASFKADREAIDATRKALQGAEGYLRHRVAERTLSRKVPHLVFVYDKSIDRGVSIENLLAKLRMEDREASF